MSVLLKIITKYVELTRIPIGDRDFYDQRKVEDLETLFDDTMTDIIDKRVEEALEQHVNGSNHDDSEY